MPAATATPVFPISEQYDGFDFNPEMYYAKVLAEARSRGHSETVKRSSSINRSNLTLAGKISSSKPDVEKSVGDVKRKRSWKNALFFWRKPSNRSKQDREQYDLNMEVQAVPQLSGFKSRSGPIYMNDFPVGQPHRSNVAHSGPLLNTLTPREGKLAQIPYVALKHPNYTRVSPSTAPLYLVT